MKIDNKETSWLEEEWDILIFLDGCRYDTFAQNKYLLNYNGILRKGITYCSGTTKWMSDTFVGKDCSNIVYINPMYSFDAFVPNHNFYKVVNVWDIDWNAEYDTVMPEAITKSALEWLKKEKNKKFIIQYVQPCPPYIYSRDKIDYIIKPGTKKNDKARIIRTFLEDSKIAKIIPNAIFWKVGSLLGYPIAKGEIYVKYGKQGVIESYTESLRLALKQINKILEEHKDKRIIITSDHGELLGERFRYGHGGFVNKLIMEVPWFEVNGR